MRKEIPERKIQSTNNYENFIRGYVAEYSASTSWEGVEKLFDLSFASVRGFPAARNAEEKALREKEAAPDKTPELSEEIAKHKQNIARLSDDLPWHVKNMFFSMAEAIRLYNRDNAADPHRKQSLDRSRFIGDHIHDVVNALLDNHSPEFLARACRLSDMFADSGASKGYFKEAFLNQIDCAQEANRQAYIIQEENKEAETRREIALQEHRKQPTEQTREDFHIANANACVPADRIMMERNLLAVALWQGGCALESAEKYLDNVNNGKTRQNCSPNASALKLVERATANRDFAISVLDTLAERASQHRFISSAAKCLVLMANEKNDKIAPRDKPFRSKEPVYVRSKFEECAKS